MANDVFADDELLSILLSNLRNAAATFGEGSLPYESIRSTVEEHLQAMKAQGKKTGLTQVQHANSKLSSQTSGPTGFVNLAFRPKPKE